MYYDEDWSAQHQHRTNRLEYSLRHASIQLCTSKAVMVSKEGVMLGLWPGFAAVAGSCSTSE